MRWKMRLTDNSVYVYFNLHKKLWSVKSRKTGRVLYLTDVVLLYDCQFRVSKAGRKRVLKEKRKNVHAGVAGELECSRKPTSYKVPYGFEDPVAVAYDPYKYESFVRKDNLKPVSQADWCIMDVFSKDKVMAWGMDDDGNGTSDQMQEELIRWMTEGTDLAMSPRSDCG